MSILTDILGVGTAAASGGLFGLVGTVVGRVFGWLDTRQKNAFEEKKWDHEYKLHELNLQARAQETEAEMALIQAQGRWEALSDSLKADAQTAPSYKWVSATKDLMRPAITIILSVPLIILAFHETDNVIRDAVIFASLTSICWWFGERSPTNNVNGKK